MTDTEQNGPRWDAYLCQPGEPPFLLGVIEAPGQEAALEAAADALAGFMPEASRDDLLVQAEGSEAPEPAPAAAAYVALELPPGALRRVELEQVSPHATRAVLMRFLSLALELEGKPDAMQTLWQLRADLRIGELGALELCDDVTREANDLLSRSDRARREAMGPSDA